MRARWFTGVLIGLAFMAAGLLARPAASAVIESVTEPPPTSSGVLSWCDPATWNGPIPDADDEAVIRGPVTLDCSVTVGAVTIEPTGSLTFAGWSTLTVDASHPNPEVDGRVEVMGELEMRPVGTEVQTITFTGIDATAMVGGDAGMMTDPGGLHVMGPGELDLDGPDRTAWTNLVGAASAGDTTIEVGDANGWTVGDQLAITPTVPGDHDAYSLVTVASLASGTVTLETGLPHDHPVVAGHTAEVLNLTRPVVISGPNSYVTVHPTAGVQHLADVALEGLGVFDVLGRYPLHFHKNPGATGSTVTRVVVNDSNNRAFVPHGVTGVRFTDTIAHDVNCTPYWWDRSRNDVTNASHQIVYDGAVASDVHACTGETVTGEKHRLAGFAMNAGTGNETTGSVAVGVEGGKDASGYHWVEGENVPGAEGVWLFANNVAHNNQGHGIFTWQNTPHPHVVSDFVAYGNGKWGVSHGAYRNGYLYERLELVANGAGGVLLHAVSRDDIQLTLQDVHVQDSPNGIRTTRHNRSPLGPMLIDAPTFTNVTVPLSAAADPAKHPDEVAVSGWTSCPVFDNSHPGSVWVLLDTGQVCTP